MIPILAKDLSCFDAYVKSMGEEQTKKGISKSYEYLFGYPDDLHGSRTSDLICLIGWMENPRYDIKYLKRICFSVPKDAFDNATECVRSILERFSG